MNKLIALSLTALTLAWGTAAMAAPDTERCAQAQARVQDDGRLGWLALQRAHPRSADAQDLLRGEACAGTAAADGYVDRRDERRQALRNDSRIGWLALHRAHPLSATAEALLTQ